MIKKILCTALVSFSLFSEANASHSNYSPMAPHQISVKASHADYSYGLSILPGNSIDSIEYINKNAFWKLNYVVLDRYLLRPVATEHKDQQPCRLPPLEELKKLLHQYR